MKKKELTKLSREFRVVGSRFLTTKFGSEQADLTRFLNFIDSNDILVTFIENNTSTNFDFEKINEEKEWNGKYQLPLEKSEEISFIYQLLKHIDKSKNFLNISFGYGTGNKYQAHIDAFNHQVTIHLINYIREYLEELTLEIPLSSVAVLEESTPQIFISYCWKDNEFCNLIESDFAELGYKVTRDQRDIKFKESIKQFMKTIGKHDFVISIISDHYLKSVNSMFEISEVMRSHEYKEKMLLIILKEKDTNFIQESIEEENPSSFAAEIYSFSHRINYIKYWEAKEQEYVQEIAGIRDDVNKIVPLQELKRIRNILSDISDFLADISDWNNTDLATLKKTDYKAFTDEISNFIKI